MATTSLGMVGHQDVTTLEVTLPVVQLKLHTVCHGTEMHGNGGGCTMSVFILWGSACNSAHHWRRGSLKERRVISIFLCYREHLDNIPSVSKIAQEKSRRSLI